jgi:hypothetical protein
MVMVLMAFCPSGVVGLIGRTIKALTVRRDPAATALRAERTGP